VTVRGYAPTGTRDAASACAPIEVIRADPGQDNQFTAGPQHPSKLVEARFRIRHSRHHILRHHHVERIVGKFELLRIHHCETLDVLEAEIVDPALRLAQHRFRNIGTEDAKMGCVLR
jgi:hypothetical protein